MKNNAAPLEEGSVVYIRFEDLGFQDTNKIFRIIENETEKRTGVFIGRIENSFTLYFRLCVSPEFVSDAIKTSVKIKSRLSAENISAFIGISTGELIYTVNGFQQHLIFGETANYSMILSHKADDNILIDAPSHEKILEKNIFTFKEQGEFETSAGVLKYFEIKN